MERSCLSYHINLFLFIAYSEESIRNFAHYNLRKYPAESLVLSKLDYNDVVFDPLPQYLMKGLQRVQNAASFVLVNPTDCINIGWLPVVQRRKLHSLIATFKALNDPHWPSYSARYKEPPKSWHEIQQRRSSYYIFH